MRESDKKDEFPNDGRKKGDYKTRYPDKKCQFKIKIFVPKIKHY